MKRLVFAAAAACLVAGCGLTLPPVSGIPAPADVADRVTLDEQGAIGVELAYKGLRIALEVATDAGLIRGERAVQVAALDNRAYQLVTATRAAYRAGNAQGYATAVQEARAVIDQALNALRGR